MKSSNYIALVEIDEEIGKYGVVVPDIPGFSSVGGTYEEAIKNATEGLASHIEVLKEFGHPVPVPRSLEEIRQDWAYWKQWSKDAKEYLVALIPILPLYGKKKILVTIDAALIARIDQVSKNRSAFFANAAERFLGLAPQNAVYANLDAH